MLISGLVPEQKGMQDEHIVATTWLPGDLRVPIDEGITNTYV